MDQNIKNRAAITDPHILKLVQECVTGTKSMGFELPESLRFLERKNATRVAGTAYCQQKIVVLSKFIYKEKDDTIRSVIYHELGHIIAGPLAKHGPIWKKVVAKMTNVTGIKITRVYTPESMPVHAEEKANASRFIFRCKGCGALVFRYKRSRFTDTYDALNSLGRPRWTCTKCGSTFERIK